MAGTNKQPGSPCNKQRVVIYPVESSSSNYIWRTCLSVWKFPRKFFTDCQNPQHVTSASCFGDYMHFFLPRDHQLAAIGLTDTLSSQTQSMSMRLLDNQSYWPLSCICSMVIHRKERCSLSFSPNYKPQFQKLKNLVVNP